MSGARRIIACILVGLGALLLAAAVMIPTYTVDKVAKTPLDLRITTIAKSVPGEESLVLDSRSLTSPEGSAKIDTNVPIVSQRFLTVEEPSDADEMTVQAGQTLRRDDRDGDSGLLTASVDRVTLNRVTGAPIDASPNGSIAVNVDASGASVADPSQRVGLQYRFPIGTEKKSYPYFDLNARATYDIEFVEESEIKGVPVYHFRQSIPVTNMWDVVPAATNKLTLPAAKWGLEGEEPVTMTRFYTNTRDVWVEPKTGAVLKGGEQIHLFYGRSANQIDVTALKSHLVFDDETIDAQLAVTQESLDKLSLFGKTLPITLGVIGALLLIAGIVLGILSARRDSLTDAPTEQFRAPRNL
ncbi:hypothetical protein BOX37_32165 [Nocardia mangyaensis]|uniref:DUF3068 domain-containing protein n=1 Tax=Nocardia mangyaensis TaxID=2213200 RepID=A0A1J0W0L8_9NOCA|nr:DUF3068 domain-containing protein [Nocardia mangyaensis]APE37818.1 hypothetical protein BOX37_32165 [Nocardia mangyaensis]